MAAEFLPLCDVLFNVISLAGYFCDVVFDVVMSYALLERGHTATGAAALTIIACSLLVSQVVSLRWYVHVSDGGAVKRRGCARYAPHVLHALQLGVLWRYAKLFVPVDLRYVKHEVRNLCMLRLVHAFCEAAPMLLLQLHVLAAGIGNGLPGPPINSVNPQPASRPVLADDRGASAAFTELNVISASLSLFSVCWALASFSKNVRLQNVHRLVLTWLGVIFQFAWRLGTISARVTALTVYASLYEHWVFLVIGLHWVSMFLWLISPKNVFHGERISRPRKAYLSALIAFVYVFAYVNLQEVNHRQKMVTFYLVMLVENCLLVCVWMAGVWGSGGENAQSTFLVFPLLLVLASFSAGIAFMLLYYRYFHVRRLGYDLGGRLPPVPSSSVDNKIGSGHFGDGCYDGPQAGTERVTGGGRTLYSGAGYLPQRNAIPGVFNCRFSNPVSSNAATKRKKKKPTSFVPPPAAPPAPLRAPRPAPLPFWRRPLPAPHHHAHCGGSSENESSSIGSRVNIHQKLQEKKQKQLAELKIIEEEIKQGKLANNAMISGDEIYSSLQRQPIPRTKKHIDLEPLTWAPPSPELGSLGQSFENLNSLSHQQSSNSPKLYDGLASNGMVCSQNNGYENFAGFSQSALAATNLVNQFIGSFPSYTEIPNVNSKNVSYESVNQSGNNNRNMSPSSQISNGEQSNSLTRQILPRTKNPRQFISGSQPQHRQNVYAADRQISDMQRASEQARLLYGDNSSPRTVLQHPNTSLPSECNTRPTRGFPESRPNFSPTNIAYDNGKSVSPRNITNMSPRTVYTADIAGSGANSYERSNNNQVNRFIDNISPRQMAVASNSNSPALYNENQSHGRQYSGVYSVTNQDQGSGNSIGHMGSPSGNNMYSESRQDSLVNCKQGNEYLRHNFGGIQENHRMYGGAGEMMTSKSGDGSNAAQNRALPFSYQVVPPPKAKLDRSGNIANVNLVEQARKMQRCKTPEILLAPHFLEAGTRQACCHWGVPYRGQQDGECCQHGEVLSSGEGEPPDLQGVCRPPSDMDSQISLPRSYTLPREFKYYRRNRQRRLMRPDHFVASTNSSDGDVDSGDDNESERLSNNSAKSTSNQAHPDTKSPQTVLNEQGHKYQQQPRQKPGTVSQHQHSVSQPSSTHFQELQNNEYRKQTTVNNQDVSKKPAMGVGNAYGKMSSVSNQDAIKKGIVNNSYSGKMNNVASSIMLNDDLETEESESHNEKYDDGVVTGSGDTPKQSSLENGNRSGIAAERQPFYVGVSPAHGRQLRNRMYGITKLGLVKHETKL